MNHYYRERIKKEVRNAHKAGWGFVESMTHTVNNLRLETDEITSQEIESEAEREWRKLTAGEGLTKSFNPKNEFDVVGFVMAFEGGELEEKQIIEGFQHLINSGLAWSLQGSYGRMAQELIDKGYCHESSTARMTAPHRGFSHRRKGEAMSRTAHDMLPGDGFGQRENSRKKEWTFSNAEKTGKYVGLVEFQSDDKEFHDFEVFVTPTRVVFGGFTNTGFIESGYLEYDREIRGAVDEALSDMLMDLEAYYSQRPDAVQYIVVNERM